MAPTLLLDILVTRSACTKHRRESPHKLPAKLLKSARPARGRELRASRALESRDHARLERGRKYSHGPHSVNFLLFRDFPTRTVNRSGLTGARSIAAINGLSTIRGQIFPARDGSVHESVFSGFSEALASGPDKLSLTGTTHASAGVLLKMEAFGPEPRLYLSLTI
jgi:hypothetical protein